MRRFALSFFALALVSALAMAQPADATAKFNERAARVNNNIAEDIARLGSDCIKWGLNVAGIEHLKHALELDAGNERAHRALGHERKQVDGKTVWEPNPKKAPPAEDANAISREHRAEHIKQRSNIYKDAGRELVLLAQFALTLELADHARASFRAALRFDPDNEDAMKATGWVKEGSAWVHPREIEERELAAKALAEPPQTSGLDKLPDWAARLGSEAKPVFGIKAGDLQVFGSGGMHREVLRYAAATRTLAAWALGGSHELRVFLSESPAQQAAYAAVRHPDAPGLGKDEIILGDNEVAVLRDEKETVTLERIVLGVARSEVRSRCGEQAGLWLELGFAGLMTQRLCASLAQVPVSGEAASPRDASKWLRALIAQQDAGKQLSLEKVMAARDLDEGHVMYAYFFARFMVQRNGAAMAPFCAALKGGEPMDRALKTATQADPARVEQSFQNWLKRQP